MSIPLFTLLSTSFASAPCSGGCSGMLLSIEPDGTCTPRTGSVIDTDAGTLWVTGECSASCSDGDRSPRLAEDNIRGLFQAGYQQSIDFETATLAPCDLGDEVVVPIEITAVLDPETAYSVHLSMDAGTSNYIIGEVLFETGGEVLFETGVTTDPQDIPAGCSTTASLASLQGLVLAMLGVAARRRTGVFPG